MYEPLRKFRGYLFIPKNKPKMFSRGILESKSVHPGYMVVIIVVELGVKRLE
jgi:hypothetical protein